MKRLLSVLLCLMMLCGAAYAAGPRFVAGAQWTNAGKSMGWYRTDVQYFVDAGPLSASVDHAAATAMVDAAASVWNISGIPFTLKNGGLLAEDVNGDNVYLGASGPVWPADAAKTNYTAKQIAVVFDADGAITETLLGSGASDPGSCRTNGVTESTDLFLQPGAIAHALIIVNGRCSGAVPELQLQLQYQLMRVFGRVIGVGWSQLNDNVFTGTPAPTYLQQQHWPIMHPIDILCGPYPYQCLPQPFTLRDDDVAGLRLLYTDLTQVSPGMIVYSGTLSFPGGLGMSGVNVTLTRNYPWNYFGTEAFQAASAVTGVFTAGDRGNPVTGATADSGGTNGSTAAREGFYQFGGVAAFTQWPATSLYFATEAINPLYVGKYAVGPYHLAAPAPSGTPLNALRYLVSPGTVSSFAMVMADGAHDCTTGADGTESQPVQAAADGVWSGRMCGVGHTSWTTFAVRAGRSATVEVMATDETGAATKSKAMPLIGIWHGSDATGTTPGMARAAAAWNSSRTGTTQLRVAFTATERVRVAVTDARGEGRPDFTYRARLLYADTVAPVRLPASGGAIRIVGTGFQAGNTVTIGGVAATVTNLSSTEIDAVAPASALMNSSGAVDVVITDLKTGGNATMTAGLTYDGAATDVLSLLTTPPATLAVGASAPLTLKLTDSNGKPAQNATIALSASTGAAIFSACRLAACTLVTDAGGIVSTQVTAQAAGGVWIVAKARSGSTATTSFTATQITRAITAARPTEYVAAGAGVMFKPSVTVTGNGAADAGQAVAWSASSARTSLSAVTTMSGVDGVSGVNATGSLRDNEAATVQACAWTSVCVSQNLIAVPLPNLRATVVSGDGQSVPPAGTLAAVTLRVVDTAGHPVAGAAVTVYQSVSGWQPPCAVSGRCSTAPVYGRGSTSAMSDDDGLITVQPLQYANTAAVTRMTASVGTQGSVTVTLQKTP